MPSYIKTLLGQVKNKILRMELHGKYEDEALIQDVLSALPKKVENTLFNYRKGLLGKVPRSRDDFDPVPILSTMEHGKNILVLDSNDSDFCFCLTQENSSALHTHGRV